MPMARFRFARGMYRVRAGAGVGRTDYAVQSAPAAIPLVTMF